VNRIGIPDGLATPRPNYCPGALLRVTRTDFDVFTRAGVKWETSPRGEGETFDARTLCDQNVLPGAGRCRACADLERENRGELARRAKATAR
jgi:hypothetical protein